MARERKFLQSISFTQAQIDGLSRLKEIDGESIAEHVRKAVDEYLKQNSERV